MPGLVKRSPKDRVLHPFRGKVSKHFSEQLAPEDAVLSYYDVRLTREDLDTLESGWLTDNVIAFWQEFLEREELRKYPSSHISLLRPTMALMLMQTPDPTQLREVLPDFSKCTHIFLPINDAHDVDVPDGGSHWSLLLVSVIDGVSFHYDSLSPANYKYASHACNQLGILLGKRLKYMNLADSPQQENGSDCGVFVCIQMRHLLISRLLNANAKEKVSMSMKNKVVDSRAGRKQMLRVIEDFRVEGERRRSLDTSRSSSPHRKQGSRSPPRID